MKIRYLRASDKDGSAHIFVPAGQRVPEIGDKIKIRGTSVDLAQADPEAMTIHNVHKIPGTGFWNIEFKAV